jgi:hypothetical protein
MEQGRPCRNQPCPHGASAATVTDGETDTDRRLSPVRCMSPGGDRLFGVWQDGRCSRPTNPRMAGLSCVPEAPEFAVRGTAVAQAGRPGFLCPEFLWLALWSCNRYSNSPATCPSIYRKTMGANGDRWCAKPAFRMADFTGGHTLHAVTYALAGRPWTRRSVRGIDRWGCVVPMASGWHGW